MVSCKTKYPYPVLRPFPEDYETSVFSAKITQPNDADYTFNTIINVDNDVIKFLVNNGSAQVGMLIQCDSTWLRKLHPLKLGEDAFSISTSDVHNKVLLCPVITASEEIDGFSSDDLIEEYRGSKIIIHPGDLLAIGETFSFNALYDDDVIRKGDPIIGVTTKPNASEMTFSFDNDSILVIVPEKAKEAYSSIQNVKEKRSVLSLIFFMPAVTEAIRVLRDEEDNYIEYIWARTIKASISELANGNQDKYDYLLDHPFQTAQKIMNGMDRAILDLDSWIVTRSGED